MRSITCRLWLSSTINLLSIYYQSTAVSIYYQDNYSNRGRRAVVMCWLLKSIHREVSPQGEDQLPINTKQPILPERLSPRVCRSFRFGGCLLSSRFISVRSLVRPVHKWADLLIIFITAKIVTYFPLWNVKQCSGSFQMEDILMPSECVGLKQVDIVKRRVRFPCQRCNVDTGVLLVTHHDIIRYRCLRLVEGAEVVGRSCHGFPECYPCGFPTCAVIIPNKLVGNG